MPRGSVTSDDNGNPVDIQEIGAGLLDANAAVTASITAVPSTLSFGYLAPELPSQNHFGDGAEQWSRLRDTGGGGHGGRRGHRRHREGLSGQPDSGRGRKRDLERIARRHGTGAGEYNGAVTLTSTSPAITLRMPYMFIVGDGLNTVVNPLYDLADWQGDGYTLGYGAVNQDIGPIPVQIIDE